MLTNVTLVIQLKEVLKQAKLQLWSGSSFSLGQKEQKAWEGSGALVTFDFLIQVLVIQMYLYCKNLLSCTLTICVLFCVSITSEKVLKIWEMNFKNNLAQQNYPTVSFLFQQLLDSYVYESRFLDCDNKNTSFVYKRIFLFLVFQVKDNTQLIVNEGGRETQPGFTALKINWGEDEGHFTQSQATSLSSHWGPGHFSVG